MDQTVSKHFLEKLYTNYLSEPLLHQALERLQICRCDALGGNHCFCQVVNSKENGLTSASEGSNPFYCKLAPPPTAPRLEKELQVTSSNVERYRAKDEVSKPKLVHYDTVDDANFDEGMKQKTRKEMDRDTLHSVYPRVAEDGGPITPSQVVSLRQKSPLTKQNTFVPVYEGLKNPYIIVINNVNFYRDPLPRHGANADEAHLEAFFDKAGFRNIKLYKDLKKHEMLQTLENIDNLELCNHDALICVVMSHGGEKGIMGWDRRYITVDQITENFKDDKFPALITKPKLFFINACRGEMEDNGRLIPRGRKYGSTVVADDIKGELPVKLPSEADFLICYSTTKGSVSYREYFPNPEDTLRYRTSMGTGSWFIQAMVQVFTNYADKEDLLSMLTRVNRAMCEFYNGGDPESGRKQISCHLSMLTRKLYFRNFFKQIQ